MTTFGLTEEHQMVTGMVVQMAPYDRTPRLPWRFTTVASERAAGDGAIDDGTRELHKLMQADDSLGYRVERPTRCELPPVSQ